MIPLLSPRPPEDASVSAFLHALHLAGFEGELAEDDATRTVLGTDNSIYQITPDAVCFPNHAEDIQRLMQVRNQPEFSHLCLYPRGGGTGTNGQSLGPGIMIDLSRHMNQILEINVEERWARVQAGAVKDHLNACIRSDGLFFAPDLSTSNRATIGGMINTDASGQGSVQYGKTRDHVRSLTAVLVTGEQITTAPWSDEQWRAFPESSPEFRVASALHHLDVTHHEAVQAAFPALHRCLTGYDLAHLRTEDGRLDVNSVLCGSEGTLAIITEAVVNLEVLPTEVALVAIQYESFMDALLDARTLMSHGATSIETVDSTVLTLAMKDFIWDQVKAYFPAHTKSLAGINLVEFTAFDTASLADKVDRFSAYLTDIAENGGRSFAHTIARGHAQVNQIWAMRKRAVGLLGGTVGAKKPVAFVEDTCVPPENLAPYIAEFRDLLDSHGLQYGMFGHVDAGVLHVRPALDLKDPEAIQMVRTITDAVVTLTHKYHGLLWGEHGKGVRSEYAPLFFGDLYPVICQVKALFDPENRLNPGKIAAPDPSMDLLKIDAVPLRGARDRRVSTSLAESASTAMTCNGNGACHNFEFDDRMCPSWKGTRDRRHTPKGRAGLMREWVTRLSDEGVSSLPTPSLISQLAAFPFTVWNALRSRSQPDFSHEVYEAMSGCLACKSCAGQCPIKVSVPTFRAQFLQAYHTRYARPVKDWLISTLEFVIPFAAQVPGFYNRLIDGRLGRALLRRLGMVDSPRVSGVDPHRAAVEAGFTITDLSRLRRMATEEPERLKRQVVIVQDAFTSYFETPLVLDVLTLLQRVGFEPSVLPFRANGKPLHVHGFLNWFKRVADRQTQILTQLDEVGVALVGIDPSMTLTYRSEYRDAGLKPPQVPLLQEVLVSRQAELSLTSQLPVRRYRLLAHCTEATLAQSSLKAWQTLFALVGHRLDLDAVGCCGMAGTYGHETRHQETSRKIYQQSWQPKIEADTDAILLASGYSCRSQVKRLSSQSLMHPASALLAALPTST
ncbi:MAG: D-2-hydroxyglutarate dehydrogenase YdiJ [Litorivicinaceae bacterium]